MVQMSQGKMEKPNLPKRFYQSVSVGQVEAGYSILLDGRPVKTPAKQLLHHPVSEIAAAIAAEWEAQQTEIDADTMPLTRLASIALDRVPHDREALLLDMLRYVETDLLCYRSPAAENAELRQRQDAAFDPVLQWIQERFAAAFVVTEGVMPVVQPEQSHAALAGAFAAANDREVAALAMMVPLLGSALLTLAIWHGAVSIDQALIAARLDEDWQAQQWGEDAEAMRAWLPKQRDLKASAFFLTGK